MAAARAAAQGKSLQDVRQAADGVVQRMHLFFAVDTLEYLHRGGRIGGASRYLGTVLNIKPILYFDLDGKLDALERARTKGKALQRLMALAEETANGHPLRIGVIHANAPQIAQEFCEQITHHLDCKEVITLELSPAIGVHVGPGTIGIALYTED
jgi:DegV family protein with EDD domain